MTSMRAPVLAWIVPAARLRVRRTARPALLALALLLAWALVPTPVRTAGREVFVAPTGSPAGEGSQASPLDLATALGANSPANVPGSTIWLRGGTYLGGAPGTNAVGFAARLQGTADAPIIIRNYQGEHAQIDHRAGLDMVPALDLQSAAYVWVWGLDIMSGGTIRQAPAAGTELMDRGMGIRNSWGGGSNTVQFLWNGQPLGSPDTTAPYALALHTTTTAALAESGYLSARATDAAGNTRTSARLFIKINNRACR